MKVAFSLKKKEVNIEADVEGIVDKELERRDKKPPRKTRYQIKQEEKRKNEELKHKQQLQMVLFGVGVFMVLLAIIIVMAILESQGIV